MLIESIVASMRNGRDQIKYRYDKNGNISEIFENGKLSVRYGYDPLGRLAREDNVRVKRTVTFEYDINGNILFKNECEFSNSQEPIYDHGSVYEYAENGNRDRLMRFDNETFDYDLLGNPLIYRNKNLEWSHLRNLVKFDDTNFSYDASGLRQSKTCGNNKTKFHRPGICLSPHPSILY